MTPQLQATRGLWMAIIFMTSAVVAGTAALATAAARADTVTVLRVAGTAFVGCATLGIASLVVLTS